MREKAPCVLPATSLVGPICEIQIGYGFGMSRPWVGEQVSATQVPQIPLGWICYRRDSSPFQHVWLPGCLMNLMRPLCEIPTGYGFWRWGPWVLGQVSATRVPQVLLGWTCYCPELSPFRHMWLPGRLTNLAGPPCETPTGYGFWMLRPEARGQVLATQVSPILLGSTCYLRESSPFARGWPPGLSA